MSRNFDFLVGDEQDLLTKNETNLKYLPESCELDIK